MADDYLETLHAQSERHARQDCEDAERRLKQLEDMARALVARAYDHEHGFYHSAKCLQCGAVGSTGRPYGGGPVKRGDVCHKGNCPVGLAHDVLEPPHVTPGKDNEP